MRSIILHSSPQDTPYLPVLKPLVVGRAKTYIDTSSVSSLTEFVLKSKARDGAAIATTSLDLLKLLAPEAKNPKISEYAGSLFNWKGTEFLILDPLEQLVTTPTAKFIASRFLSKVISPEIFLSIPPFKWELFEPSRTNDLIDFLFSCDLIAVDIETIRDHPDRLISCVGYTGVSLGASTLTLRTVVVPADSEYNIAFVRVINDCPAPKVLQNGKYDIAYFMRYRAPLRNYLLDTINLFHSWYSELPKDLGFISSFMLREYQFHKNDGKTGNLQDYYAYNAKDTYTTALTAMAILLEYPDYAERNYLMEFPVVFPCILSESTGIKWDQVKAQELKERTEKDMEEELGKLRTMLACPNFNPSSPQQTLRVFHMLGSKDIADTTPPSKDKVANRHPLNRRIVDGITSYRETRKLRSSYFKEGVSWRGRVFYALNPHGTDTGRLASRESQLWCGLQIQNIPRDGEEGDITVKEAFVADDGFLFGEADYSQNEARGTGYLSGDTNLIAAVDDETTDFHGRNASAFFGVPYGDIVKSSPVVDELGNVLEWVHKTVNKPLRDLSKRTNHGANYNMGAKVMLDTMGIAKVLLARKLLKLPQHWSLLQVTGYLLEVYAKTYPTVKGAWYAKVVSDVMSGGLLVGPTGWTRRCFGNPKANKHHLNSYVAHPPQSLAAMVLNKAYVRVFNNVYLPNPHDFKLIAQIHDSIPFQYRIGYEHLAWKVSEQMRIPVEVKDTFGITRTLVVPVDLKGGARRWSDVKTLKREVGRAA